MTTDFADYSVNNGWDAEANVHQIMEGAVRESDKQVLISTWQSIYDYPKEYFQQFGLIIGDEAHGFQAKSLESLMQKTTNTPLKFGLTGTVQDTKVHRLVLEGLFGPVRQLVKTSELQKRGFLSPLKVKICVLAYPDTVRKQVNKFSYNEEVEYIAASPQRLMFLKNLALSLKGNTLLLFHLVDKHGKIIYDELTKSASGRKIFFIYGGVEADERNEIRHILETETDAILVASYGTFSTGSNVKNLHNLILGTAFKSKIRNLQSIGRVLRRAEGKELCTLFDIADDFSWKEKPNYSLKHLKQRVELYNEEDFQYKLYKVSLNA